MPTVHVPVDFFHRLAQRTFNHEELEKICFDFGIEFEFEEPTAETPASYAFEVASNRYDLLSAEGIARNLLFYMNLLEPVKFKVNRVEHPQKIIVR